MVTAVKLHKRIMSLKLVNLTQVPLAGELTQRSDHLAPGRVARASTPKAEPATTQPSRIPTERVATQGAASGPIPNGTPATLRAEMQRY
jgi:hypothetical protein